MKHVVCEEVRLLTTCRWRICFMTLTGTLCLLAMRANLGFAIVCMVVADNSTTPTTGYNVSVPFPWIGNASDFRLSRYILPGNDSRCGAHPGTELSGDIQGAEFSWDKPLQSKLLASFYYGYGVTQVPGGWLARRYGPRRVIGYSVLLLVASTMLFPVGSRVHVYLAFGLRVLAGLASGVVFPAMSCLWGRWAPPLERTKLYAVQFTGVPLGSVLTLSIAGFLCQHGFDNGWGSIFYSTGLSGMIWVVLWFLVAYDSPRDHPTISKKEREFIEKSIGDVGSAESRRVRTPWRSILTSSAVWAGVIAHSGTNWTVATLLTGLPTYMKEVLDFNIQDNGVLSAVPFLCSAAVSPVVGYLADALRQRKLLNTRNTRRLFESISGLGTAGFLVLAGFVTCDNRLVSVVYLSVASACLDVVKAGQGPNSLDIAPRFAGEIWGLSNTLATVPGMIAPIVNGLLTPNGTQEEWQTVFYLCAGFAVSKTVIFFIFVQGHQLSWAKGDVSTDPEIPPNSPAPEVTRWDCVADGNSLPDAVKY